MNYQQEPVAPVLGGGGGEDGGGYPGNPYDDQSCNPAVMTGRGGYSTHYG